eukprot:SAG31_NODE_13081_length_894_cov_1.096855_2_plen_186_part_01
MPYGARDRSGRPVRFCAYSYNLTRKFWRHAFIAASYVLSQIQMEVIAATMELAWALSKQGDHQAALSRLAKIRQWAPTKEMDRQHFERTVLFEEARLLRCAGELGNASDAYTAALDIAVSRGELPEHTGQRARSEMQPSKSTELLDFAVRIAEQTEVLRWQGRHDEADVAARWAARLAGWPSSGVQ